MNIIACQTLFIVSRHVTSALTLHSVLEFWYERKEEKRLKWTEKKRRGRDIKILIRVPELERKEKKSKN